MTALRPLRSFAVFARNSPLADEEARAFAYGGTSLRLNT
jgi:hypothetical protein